MISEIEKENEIAERLASMYVNNDAASKDQSVDEMVQKIEEDFFGPSKTKYSFSHTQKVPTTEQRLNQMVPRAS